ncbi:MAG TPA: hypothetical protein VHF06_03610 [Pseudonocardiaceae bacterium]|jgi:hypothetical protein|nr:hypothetical protein [Pseudonocardiaceae bacterium]
MNRMNRPAAVARRLGWGHNALRRPLDRIENAARVAAVVLTIAATPLAMSFGSACYHSSMALSAEQTATSHAVTATLVEATNTTVTLESMATTVPATARWTGPDGSRHTGIVSAPQQAPAGTTVHIWTDAHGTPIDAPLSPAQAWGRGVLIGILTMLAAAAVCAVSLFVLRLRLDKIRYAAWEAEWREIDPWRTRHGS